MTGTPDTATLRRVYYWVTEFCMVFTAVAIVVSAALDGWGMVAVLSLALAFFVYAHERGLETPEN